MQNHNGMADTSKQILKSNFLIVYKQLECAIHEYASSGHTTGNLTYVDAYLAASIHAAMDYIERFKKIKLSKKVISACRYANNTLKHNPRLITHRKAIGGFEFPFGAEESFSFEEIDIVWNFDPSITMDLKVHDPKVRENLERCFNYRKACFKSTFAGKSILETLESVFYAISNDQRTCKLAAL